MSPENQAIQRDDTLNPGFLWVLDGEALWGRADGAEGKSCRGCHGDAAESMRGVAARYPAFDPEEKRPVGLQERVNICRRRHQNAPILPYESPELLALTGFLGKQSRGMPIDLPDDPRLAPAHERGKALFERRIGQLNLSCSQAMMRTGASGSAGASSRRAIRTDTQSIAWNGRASDPCSGVSGIV